MSWVSLCRLDELVEGKGKYIEIDGFHLAVFLDGHSVKIIDSTCPHAGANLADGELENGCVTCPWHAWSFNLTTGQLHHSPGIAIKTYPTRLHPHQGGDLVQVQLPTY